MKYAVTIMFALVFVASCVSVNKGPKKDFTQVKEHDVVFDAIIVPGIPFEGEVWDSVMKARVIWSYVLYKNGIAKNVIYSGSAVYSPYYEAKIMGLYGKELGIPEEHIYYDTQARHSTENVYYSYIIAKEQGFKTVALATDPFQSALLRRFTSARLGTQIYHMPFVMDSVRKYSHITPEIDPKSAKRVNFYSITDEETPLQRIKGTMGMDIDWKKHDNKMLPPL